MRKIERCSNMKNGNCVFVERDHCGPLLLKYLYLKVVYQIEKKAQLWLFRVMTIIERSDVCVILKMNRIFFIKKEYYR